MNLFIKIKGILVILILLTAGMTCVHSKVIKLIVIDKNTGMELVRLSNLKLSPDIIPENITWLLSSMYCIKITGRSLYKDSEVVESFEKFEANETVTLEIDITDEEMAAIKEIENIYDEEISEEMSVSPVPKTATGYKNRLGRNNINNDEDFVSPVTIGTDSSGDQKALQ